MKFESKYHLVIDEIAFEKVVCEIVAILSSGGGGGGGGHLSQPSTELAKS